MKGVSGLAAKGFSRGEIVAWGNQLPYFGAGSLREEKRERKLGMKFLAFWYGTFETPNWDHGVIPYSTSVNLLTDSVTECLMKTWF